MLGGLGTSIVPRTMVFCSLSLLYSIHFNLAWSSSFSSIAAVRYVSKCPVPTSSTLSCVVAGGCVVGLILAHCTFSKESLPEFFEHALGVIYAVDHTSPADTLWFPYSSPMSASVLSLRDELDRLSMRPLSTSIGLVVDGIFKLFAEEAPVQQVTIKR